MLWLVYVIGDSYRRQRAGDGWTEGRGGGGDGGEIGRKTGTGKIDPIFSRS